ncbi:MAG: hypothetical protein PHU33_13455 [Bacteroidales bacterium]|nr:hypothetical protein [Bacteroidales bacterium]
MLLTMVLLLLTNRIDAQVTISGKTIAEDGSGIGAIHVLVYQQGGTSIKSFGITKPDGSFSINVNLHGDSLLIKISSINYQNQTIVIRNETHDTTFVLKPDVKQLEGVTVATNPIAKYGDTLSYLLKPFVRENDRSIEDVLRRMPGITVEPNGQILYQDIPINKFYIEGMDITGGNYGLVSRNLPQESVSAVEIFENHQPVRILQDVQFSSQAALNLKLKRKVAATGSASASIGAAPFLWQFNCTPLIFSKKNQFIVSVQGNNTGTDLLQQTLNFDSETAMEKEAVPEKLVDVTKPASPEIATTRYLDNRTWLLNLNSLHYLSSDFQIKTSLSLTDDNRHSGASETMTLFTATDTIETKSFLRSNQRGKRLMAKVFVNQNTKASYTNNEMCFSIEDNRAEGISVYNQQTIAQSVNNPSLRLSNGFRSIKSVGSRLVHLNSDVLYISGNQALGARPVVIADSFFVANKIDSVNQSVKTNRFYTNNSAKMSFTFNHLTINNEFGFSYKSNSLVADLLTFSVNRQQYSDSSFINNLVSHSFVPVYRTDASLKKERLTLSASGRIGYSIVSMNNSIANSKANYRDFLHEENFTLLYKISPLWQLRMSAGYSKTLENINTIFPGYIVSSYRHLESENRPISHVIRLKLHSYISYRNSMKAFFNSVSYTLLHSNFDYSFSDQISSQGSTISRITNSPGHSSYHNISGYSSKYLRWLRSTVSLKANATLIKKTLLLNQQNTDVINRFITLNPGLMFQVAGWMNVDYTGSFAWFNSFLNKNAGTSMSMFKQYLNVILFPLKNHSLSLNSEYYVYENQSYYFSDVSYQYTIPKTRTDIIVTARNIFNSDSYTSINSNTYYTWIYKYDLRPFELLVSIKLYF